MLEDLITTLTQHLQANTLAIQELSSLIKNVNLTTVNPTSDIPTTVAPASVPTTTEKTIPPKPSKVKKELESEESSTTLKVTEEVVAKTSDDAQSDYETTRLLIKKLAPTHRDQIKLLNAKHKLSKFADILNDPDNPDAGIKDAEKLKLYYAELLELNK